MKKWRWFALGIAVILLGRMEHTGAQINYLEPVETVLITQNNGNIIIETDTGAKGVGSTLEKAIENLHSSTASDIFLDTAQYLLVSSRTEKMISQMTAVIRPAARVCKIRGEVDLAEVTGYLRTHPPKVQLKDLMAEEAKLQTLYYQEGRGQLAE